MKCWLIMMTAYKVIMQLIQNCEPIKKELLIFFYNIWYDNMQNDIEISNE